jgi:hypothetical protein
MRQASVTRSRISSTSIADMRTSIHWYRMSRAAGITNFFG